MTDVLSRLASRVCDGHMHVGRDHELGVFPPEVVARDIRALGLMRAVVSSLSAADEDPQQADAELLALSSFLPGQVIPLLWVTPLLVERGGLDAIPSWYRGLKVHPLANGWMPGDEGLRRVFEVATARHWPVKMHTGWTPESRAARFEGLYRDFPGVKVVLAHGRPLDETVSLVNTRANTFADSAYMALGDVRQFVRACGHDRLVFGSDFPVDRHYFPRASATNRYRRRVAALVRCFGETAFLRWAHDNVLDAYGD